MTTPPGCLRPVRPDPGLRRARADAPCCAGTSPSARRRPRPGTRCSSSPRAGPGLDREALSRDLEGSPTLDADSTRELLARLEADGLIRGDAEVDLTTAGEAVHRSLRESIAGPRNQLLSQFDVEDVETTVRTLQAITARAEEQLAVAELALSHQAPERRKALGNQGLSE